jgi:hypothetical protein
MLNFQPISPPSGQPTTIPQLWQMLTSWAWNNFTAIQRAANAESDCLCLKVWHEAPPKTFGGMVVYFDGVDHNPGSGEGLYRRNVANDAWVFIG